MTFLGVLLAAVSSWIVIPTVVAATLLILTTLTPRKTCPKCKQLLPRFRKPDSVKQMIKGGWTCPTCETEIDRRGQPLE